MLLPLFVDVLLVQYYSTQPSMLLLLSTLSSVPRTWSCYGMRIWYTWGVGTHWLISTYSCEPVLRAPLLVEMVYVLSLV